MYEPIFLLSLPLLNYLGLLGSQGGSPDLLSQKLCGEGPAACVLASALAEVQVILMHAKVQEPLA